MNGQNKSGQLTFESTIEPVEKTKTETPVFETRNDVRVVRVLPDVPAIDKTFDYLVPESWIKDGRSELLEVGSMVRMPFGGRQVNGWVLEIDVEPQEGMTLLPLSKYRSVGPSYEVIQLARWAAERWVGRLNSFLITASPPKNIPFLSQGEVIEKPKQLTKEPIWFEDAVKDKKTVLRLPPSEDLIKIASEFASRGNTLILSPSISGAQKIAKELKRKGLPVSIVPEEWHDAAVGGSVIGSRSAVFAPVSNLSAILVFDEHDSSYQGERAPTWNARDVAIERAKREQVPCVLTSAIPTLEAISWGHQVKPSRKEERDGWPVVEIIDRKGEDPTRSGLLSERLTPILRDSKGPVVCVLNRKGRSRLLACNQCGSLALCEKHAIPLIQKDNNTLECQYECEDRPVVCESCGSTKFKNLRAGIARLKEELEALSKKNVVEVSAEFKGKIQDAEIFIGTEAVLHRIQRAARVIFLEFDQELLASRFRASEQAASLIIRGARLLGSRNDEGRLIIQTRQPEHEVLQAALHANPEKLIDAESERRKLLQLPPYSALAQISGDSAIDMVESLKSNPDIEIMGPREGSWLLRAVNNEELSKAILRVGRPKGKIRIEIDPRRA